MFGVVRGIFRGRNPRQEANYSGNACFNGLARKLKSRPEEVNVGILTYFSLIGFVMEFKWL